MQVRWTLRSMWAAASLLPGTSLLALAQVCKQPLCACVTRRATARTDKEQHSPTALPKSLEGCWVCAQVPLTMGNFFLMFRSAFCIAASLTTNELIGRGRYGYMKARLVWAPCACLNAMVVDTLHALRVPLQDADGRHHNRFDRGPVSNCMQFWEKGWPDWAAVFEEAEQVVLLPVSHAASEAPPPVRVSRVMARGACRPTVRCCRACLSPPSCGSATGCGHLRAGRRRQQLHRERIKTAGVLVNELLLCSGPRRRSFAWSRQA